MATSRQGPSLPGADSNRNCETAPQCLQHGLGHRAVWDGGASGDSAPMTTRAPFFGAFTARSRASLDLANSWFAGQGD
jgi:hypothetical protein